jgi:NAD(P)-dependent dehydrogenase (short-subunit alcohol dehydrogenase family)
MGRFEGKVAVVTGGGNGIGRSCALRFAQEGASVVVADLMEGAAVAVADEIEAAGGDAVATELDAASRDGNEHVASLAVQRFGRIDVLLTAAGISHSTYRSGDVENEVKRALQAVEYLEKPWQQVLDLERDDWQRVLDVNLSGTLFAVQACAARMIDAGHGGAIVTIASIAAKDPDAGPIAYTVSKAGVWMLTKKLSRLLAPAGIRVNSIGPGFIETNMTQIIGMLPADRRDMLLTRIPMGRVGQPVEIANVALFLASDDSSYMTGELLHPDGGWFTD